MTKTKSFFFGLRGKLLATTLFIVILSMWILSLTLLALIKSELFHQTLNRTVQLTRSIERTIRFEATALRRRGGPSTIPSTYQMILLLFSEEKDLLGLSLDGREEGMIARQGEMEEGRNDLWQLYDQGLQYQLTTGDEPRLLIKAVLQIPGNPLELKMLYSLESINQAIARAQINVIVQILSSALLIFIFLGLVMTLIVIKPINILRQGMEKISSGNLDHQLEMAPSDELGYLAASFNDMVSKLNENRETIEKQVKSLKLAHQETIEAQNKLISAEKMASLGALAAGVAHEVGNPLGAVIGYMDLLKKDSLDDREKKDCLYRAYSELQRIHRIMFDLLNYARPSDEPSSSLDVNAIIRKLLENIKKEAAFAKLEVRLDLQEDLPRPNGFHHKLEQVFINLIKNASLAIEDEGHLLIKTTLAGGGINNKNELIITFTDNGCGIPEDDLDRVFDPFFTSRSGQGGTGLGLAVSKRIIEEMGGRIKVESTIGEKTSFIISLPV